MLDWKLKPWLLEVNHSPSFNTDSDLDYDLKLALITDTIKLLGLNPARKSKYKRTKQRELNERMMGKHKNAHASINDKEIRRRHALKKRLQHEESNLGEYELLFPSAVPEDNVRYARYAEEAMKIWEKFTGSYKPPAKVETPQLKKKLKKGTTSSVTTTRNTKKSSVRLSLGRPVHSRDKSTRIQIRQMKKTVSERIEPDSKDIQLMSIKYVILFRSYFNRSYIVLIANSSQLPPKTHVKLKVIQSKGVTARVHFALTHQVYLLNQLSHVMKKLLFLRKTINFAP